MKKIWFRVGMECQITDSEYEILMNEQPKELMETIIERATLSGETYLPMNLGDESYDNSEDEINFCF